MTDWQPIATAPKDGKPILLFVPYAWGPDTFIGAWWEQTTTAFGKVTMEIAEWSLRGAFRNTGEPKPAPSHWMPLPAPPVI